MGAVGIAFLTIAAHARDLARPLRGDDVYVLEALRSASWWRRLFAFDMDAPGADYTPWWTGVVLQRRFIRVPPSALLWLESHFFGASPAAFSVVALGLVLTSCLLIYAEGARHFSPWKAAMIALVPALHPCTSEVVETMNQQPLPTAGLLCVASAVCWIRMRERFSIATCAGALGACALAVTAYEAAIALPFALVLADLTLEQDAESLRRRWGPRLGALGVAALYAPFAVAIRRGLVAPDTSGLRSLGEVALALRYDTVAYVFKAVGLFDPRDPPSYWLQRTAGEPVAVAVALAMVLGLVRIQASRFDHRRLGLVGLAVFVLFLAPPLLTRAAVSSWNFPTLRQLYLPVLLGGPLMMAAWLAPRSHGGERRWSMSAAAWLTTLIVFSILFAGRLTPNRDAENIGRATAALLQGLPAGDTVVGVGHDSCRFSPSLIRDGPALLAIPAGRKKADPDLRAVGPNELIASAEGGFDITETEKPPQRVPGPGPGPAWITRRPPPLIHQGWQRIPGATVMIAGRAEDRITALRYDFDRPLTELVFLRFQGCKAPRLMVVR